MPPTGSSAGSGVNSCNSALLPFPSARCGSLLELGGPMITRNLITESTSDFDGLVV